MSKQQSSEGREIKRFIEAVSLAVTFLACSLTLIYVVIHSSHLVSFPNILCILFALISFCVFLFFTVALCKTKLSDYYDQIFESPRKRQSWSILFGIFVTAFWLAIAVGLITGLAPLFNEILEGWRLLTAIFVIVWLFYVIAAMLKTAFWGKRK